jgi:hypothetical protein
MDSDAGILDGSVFVVADSAYESGTLDFYVPPYSAYILKRRLNMFYHIPRAHEAGARVLLNADYASCVRSRRWATFDVVVA